VFVFGCIYFVDNYHNSVYISRQHIYNDYDDLYRNIQNTNRILNNIAIPTINIQQEIYDNQLHN